MILRIAGIFIIIAILFSYLPMDAMGNCSEEDHSGNTRMDCGYAFHCPVIYNPAIPRLSVLSINSWLRWMPTIGKIEELARLIFHPPEKSFKYDRKG